MHQTISPRLPAAHRVAVSAAFFANGLLIGSWAPQIPVFAARLGLSESAVGLMILAFGIGAVASMPLVGRVIGRVGSRGPMLVLQLALALALPAVVFAPGIAPAVLAVVFMGIATGGMDVAMNANAVSVERRLPSPIMSACHGFWSVGGLVGAGAGGFAIDTIGAEAHALVVGVVVLAVFALVRNGALDDRVAPAAVGIDAAGDAASAPGAGASYAKAIAVGCFALFAMIPEGAAIDWSAIYLRQELGSDASASGLAFAAFSLTMAVFRFAGDGIRNRLGAVTTARYCSVAAAAGLLLVGLAGSTPTALVGFAIMGIGIANIVPIAFSAAGNVEGLPPGTGLSIVTTLGYSGILVAPSAIGFIAERTGFAVIFACLAVLFVFTFLAARLVAGADRPAAVALAKPV